MKITCTWRTRLERTEWLSPHGLQCSWTGNFQKHCTLAICLFFVPQTPHQESERERFWDKGKWKRNGLKHRNTNPGLLLRVLVSLSSILNLYSGFRICSRLPHRPTTREIGLKWVKGAHACFTQATAPSQLSLSIVNLSVSVVKYSNTEQVREERDLFERNVPDDMRYSQSMLTESAWQHKREAGLKARKDHISATNRKQRERKGSEVRLCDLSRPPVMYFLQEGSTS